MSNQKFSYEEKKDALSSRISAHLQFSDFNLHNWIKQNFDIASGSKILDLGCGNGNFTNLFWDFVQPQGAIIGLDKNASVIEEAKEQKKNLPQDKVKFFVHDFDKPFPDFGMSFNWIFSIFSLYYTEDSNKLLEKTKSLLAKNGTFVVIGPGPKNVRDLTDFSQKLTGQAPNNEHFQRIERICNEFYPQFKDLFGKTNVTYQEIDSVMTFPDAESFGQYYWSTLLWRESIQSFSKEKVEALKQETLKQVSRQNPIVIKKQISCLVGKLN